MTPPSYAPNHSCVIGTIHAHSVKQILKPDSQATSEKCSPFRPAAFFISRVARKLSVQARLTCMVERLVTVWHQSS